MELGEGILEKKGGEMMKNGVGLGGLLFVLFLGLKLGGAIDWSWWWVFAPLYVPAAIILVLCCVLFSMAGILMSLEKAIRDRRAQSDGSGERKR